MTILEAAITLRKNNLNGMSATTIIRYFDIYKKYESFRDGMKYADAIELTAERCYCSEDLVKKVITWHRKISL